MITDTTQLVNDTFYKCFFSLYEIGTNKKVDFNFLLMRLLKWPEKARKYCDFSSFGGEEWCNLLLKCYWFDDLCNYDLLTSELWSKLLRTRPQYGMLCPWEKMDCFDLCQLLIKQPMFARMVDLSNIINEHDWNYILQYRPALAVYKPK